MRQLEPARARTELGADEMAALQLVDGAIRNAVRSAGRGVHRSARAALRDERPFELRAQIALADAAGIRSRDDRVRVERRQDLVHIAERLQVSGRDLDHVLWQRIPQTPACDLKLDRLNVLALDLHQTPAGVDAHLEKIADELLRAEEHTSELQSRENLVCRLLLDKKNGSRGRCFELVVRSGELGAVSARRMV